ncbi:MAG: Ig-like domain-containing protein, partial [Candidatus Zixiibacteriota bacterium]
MKFLKIPILLILLLLPASVFSQIQNLSPDSAHYEVKIGQFYGGPGDTVMMPIYIRNQNDINTELFNGTISGMLLRIVYDSLASDMEDLLIPIVKYADPISTVPPSFIYYLQVLTTGRGDGLIYVNHTNYVPDTSTLICYNQNKQDSLTNYLVILYSPPFNINTSIGEEFPVIPASGTDATVCLYVPMRVNPNAQIGCTTRLYFKDYDFEEEYINQFSSGTSDTSIVTQLIRPYLNNKLNIFTVSDNDPPVIDPISPNSISIQAGQSIAAVTVSATDPNGDNLCLTAYDLPTGATFGTSGEVCGTGSASGTLNWTTTTAISGTFTVNFMAEDAEGATSINSTVTIVVNPYNPSNQPPTIATISPNTFTVQQGEAIPPVTVTATDPEG